MTRHSQIDPTTLADKGRNIVLAILALEAYSWGVGEYESEDGCDGFWEGL